MATSPPIYIDSCCFIDAVKNEVGLLPNGRGADVWYLQKLMLAHQTRDVTLYTSMLAVAECVAVEAGQTDVPREVQDAFRRLLTSGQYVRLVTPTPQTARVVQDLRWTHKLVLKGADALHIATALELGAVEYLSTDERLKTAKLKTAIPILAKLRLSLITPKETGWLPPRYLQPDMINGQKPT